MITCKDYIKSQRGKACLFYIKTGVGFCKRPDRFRCIESMKRKAPILSYSGLNNYTRCRKKYYLSYVKGIIYLKPSPAMIAGSLLHLYLSELHQEDGMDIDLIESSNAYHNIINKLNLQDGEELPDDILRARAAARAYLRIIRYDIEKGDTEVKDIKYFDNGFFAIKAVADCICDDNILEFKFTKNFDYFCHFTTKIQASFYLNVFNKKSITFRLIKSLQLKRKDKETQDEYIDRIETCMVKAPKRAIQDKKFYRSEYDFDEVLKYLKVIASEIKNNIDNEEFFYCNTNGCYFPGICEYLPICKSGVISESLYKISDKIE